MVWLGMIKLLNIEWSPLIIQGVGIGLAFVGFVLAHTIQHTPGFSFQTLHRRLQIHRKLPEVHLDPKVLVSISPDRSPQLYEKLWFWDVGHISICGSDLIYLGDLEQLRLPATHISSIHWGRNIPSWWSTPSLYIDWYNPQQQTQGTWRLEFRAPKTRWVASAQARQYYNTLQNWLHSSPSTSVPEALSALELPQFYHPYMGDALSPWDKIKRLLMSVIHIELLGITGEHLTFAAK